MARRGWREGSICRRTVTRGERTYHYFRAIVSLGSDPSGRRIRLSHQTRTERDARAWLKTTLGRTDRGLPVRGDSVTVGDYAVDWLRDTALTVRPATADFYRYALVHAASIRDVQLSALTPAHVRGLIASMAAKGEAPTARRTVQTLSMMLKRALEDGLVDRNVAALVRLPKLEPKEPEHFTAEQARRFLEVAEDDPLGSLYAVALGTGLRRGELLALTWRDADPVLGVIRVRHSKTQSGVRTVPLPAFAAVALADCDRHPGPIWPVSPSHASRHFQELCRKAGVPVLTMHSTRHTAASLMLDAGVEPLVIQQLIGHTRVSMTAHYARSSEARRRDAAEALGATMAAHDAHG